jgi:hypothetical protein
MPDSNFHESISTVDDAIDDMPVILKRPRELRGLTERESDSIVEYWKNPHIIGVGIEGVDETLGRFAIESITFWGGGVGNAGLVNIDRPEVMKVFSALERDLRSGRSGGDLAKGEPATTYTYLGRYNDLEVPAKRSIQDLFLGKMLSLGLVSIPD